MAVSCFRFMPYIFCLYGKNLRKASMQFPNPDLAKNLFWQFTFSPNIDIS